MQENNVTSVREVFEKMSIEQLDEILNRELHREPPDTNAIRLILDILREREKDMHVELTPEMQAAWEKYQTDIAKISQQSSRARRMRRMFVRLVSSAAVLVLAFMLLVPQEAKAKGLWDWLVRVTEDVVEFFTPADTESRIMEYEFKTDNPGLQRVYDTAVEHGVDFPAVPMCLMDGAELKACNVLDSPSRRSIMSTFMYDGGTIVHNIDIYNQEVAHSFEKDETRITVQELFGTEFTIMRNNNVWTAVWGKDNIECSIFIDCQEDELYKILRSIYVMEET